MNNWKNDPERNDKLLVFDVMVEAFNRFYASESEKISLRDMVDFIDEWFKNHPKVGF